MREAAEMTARPRQPARGGAFGLHTATLRVRDADGVLELFHACRVGCEAEVVRRLAVRVGRALAGGCAVRRGVDPCDPVVRALLPDGIVRSLACDGDLPGRALAGGGDLHVVQRRG